MRKLIPFILYGLCFFVIGCTTDQQAKNEVPKYENPAVEKVSEQIKFNPKDAELYRTRAVLFSESELYEDAIKDMKTALSFDSASLAYRHILADFYYDSEQDEPALQLLKETISMFPESEPTLLKLTEFQFLLDQPDEAIATIQQLIDVNKENVEAYYMMGRCLAKKGDSPAAIQQFEKALAMDTKHSDSMMELATIYSNDGNTKALDYLNTALKLSPNDVDILFELGNFYFYQKNGGKALTYYKKVVLLDQQYTDAHINSGIINMNRESYPAALQLFNVAVETDPSYPSAYYFRGKAYQALGDIPNARKNLQQALDLNADFPEAIEALKELEQ